MFNIYELGSMTSSSSCLSSIQTRSGPIEGDVLWMQPKHVSKHVWNREPNRKLHIRRAVPTYQGEEQILEEIVPLLWQSEFYWIMKMGYLKINRPETHTFHLRCEEATITLQDVSVLLGLRTDGAPLIGSTNLDWADLCEELLGVRPQENELEGSVVKLTWLAHHFSHINIDEGNVEQLQRFTRAWILRFIGGVLFVNKSSSRVSLRYLQFLHDFEQCSMYAWGPAVLAATDYKVKSIGGMCILIQMWAWERCTTLAPKRTPPVIENKPLRHRWLQRGNQHIGNDELRVFRRKLDLMKRHEGEVVETLQYMVSPQGRNTWTVDDLVPYVDKLAIISEEQERITEPVSHGPASEREFPAHEFHILQSSVETRGIGRRREPCGHGMYYTLATFSEYPSQMYQYPFEGHHTDTSAIEHSFGGVAKTQPHFSWPTMTPSHFLLRLSKKKQGDNAEEEILIVKHEDGIDHVTHPHDITDTIMTDFDVSMYQYPFEGHHTDTSASEHSFGGVVKTQPHFSWPTMTPSQSFLLRLSKKKQGDNAEEEILIVKREDGIDHVAHPHDITDTIMTDFDVSVWFDPIHLIPYPCDFVLPFARIVVGSGISVHASLEGGIAASFPRGHHCAE
ncbi:Serine/threonine-protein phosphatase 7 long form [Glycine soja]